MITLATHRRWRTASLFALYAAQGAPEGLLYVALPAWLAANGVSPAAIGAFIAAILLPWSFKIFNGVLMDRFTLPAMGRRRPWILGAQTCLIASLVVLAAGSGGDIDLVFLTSVGVIINLAAAFQDVAIDGMAIDLIPEQERGRANGVMWGGKTLGLAASSAASAYLIAWGGVASAALGIAAFAALAFLFPLLLRERDGEKLLPWTSGQASPVQSTPDEPRFLRMAARVLRALLTPQAALFALGIVAAFCAYGLKTAFAPTLAVQRLDWSETNFGNLAATANLIGGVFGILLSGLIADKLGATRAILISLAAMAALHAGMAALEPHWTTPAVFAGFYVLHAQVFVLLSVSIYARAMALSRPDIAATHFAAFMALLNLGTSLGAQQLRWIHAEWDYRGLFLASAAVCVVAIALFRAASLTQPRAAG